MIQLVKESEKSKWASDVMAYTALGKALATYPPAQKDRLPLLNVVWRAVKAETDFNVYARACVVYVELLVKHYSDREVLILLKDLVKHANNSGDGAVGDNLEQLESIIEIIVKHTSDFGAIVTSEHFMALMDLFKSDKKTQVWS